METENLLTSRLEPKVYGAKHFSSPLKRVNDLMDNFYGKIIVLP